MMTGDTGLDGSTLFTGSVRLPVAPRNSTVTAFGTTLRMDQTTLTIPDTDATDDHELHAQLSRSGTLAQDFDQTLSHVPVVPGAVDGTAPIAQRSAMGGSGAPTPYHQQLEWRQGIAASVPGSSHPSNTGSRTQGGHSPLSTSTAESRGGATSVTATSQAPASQGPRSGVGGGELVVAGGDQGYRSVGAASSVAANPFRETESRSERGTAAPRNDASAATNPFAFVVSELTSQAEQSLRDLRSRGMGQTLTHPPTSAPPQQPNPYRSAPAPAASALGSKSSRPALSAAAMTNAASAPPGVADVGTPTKTQSQSQSRVMINDKPGGGGGADRADASMRSCISQREWTGDANHSARSMGRSGSPGPSDDMGRSMRSRVSFSQELERPASNPALNQSRGRSPSKLRGGDGNDAGPDEYKSLGGGGSVAPNPFTDVESRADPSSRVESHRSTASAREGGGASPSRVQSQPPSVAAPGSSAAAGAHPSTNQPLSQAPSQLNMTHGSFAPTESQQEMSTLSHMDSRRSSNPAHNHPSHNASPSRPQSHRSAASSAAPNPFTEVESRADLSMSRAESHRSAVSNRDRSPSKVQSQQSMAGPASSVVPNPFTEVESRADLSMSRMESQRSAASTANRSPSRTQSQRSAGPASSVVPNPFTEVESRADLSVSHRSTVSNRDRSPSKVRSQQSQANQSVRSVAGPASSVAANPFTEVESRADLSMSRMESGHRSNVSPSRRASQGPQSQVPSSAGYDGSRNGLSMTVTTQDFERSAMYNENLRQDDSAPPADASYRSLGGGRPHSQSPSQYRSLGDASSAAPNPFTEVESRADLSMSRAESHRSAVSNRDRSPSKVQSQQSMAGPASSVAANPFTEVVSRVEGGASPGRVEGFRSAATAVPARNPQSMADVSMASRAMTHDPRAARMDQTWTDTVPNDSMARTGPQGGYRSLGAQEVESRADLSSMSQSQASGRDGSPSRAGSQATAVRPRSPQAQSQANITRQTSHAVSQRSVLQEVEANYHGEMSYRSVGVAGPRDVDDGELSMSHRSSRPQSMGRQPSQSPTQYKSLGGASSVVPNPFTEVESRADLSMSRAESHRSTVSNRDRPSSRVQSQQSQANQSMRSVGGPASSVAPNPFTEVESRADLSSRGPGGSPTNMQSYRSAGGMSFPAEESRGADLSMSRMESHRSTVSPTNAQSHGHRSMGPASSVVPNPFTEVESRADLSVSHRSTVSNRDRSPSKVRSQQSQANQSVRSVAGPASSVAANPFTEVESRADLSMSRVESQRSAVSPSRRASQAQSQANESMRSAYDDVFLSKSQHERIPSQGLSQVSAPTSAPPAVHQEKSTSEMFYNDHTEPPREEEPESMRSLVDQCSLDTAAFQATVGLTETYNFGDADGDANPGWQSTTMDLAPPQQSHRSGVPHDPQSTAVRSVAASAAPYTHDSCGAGASHPGNFDGSGMGSERVFSHTHHSEAPSQSHGHRSMGPASSVVPNPFTEVESRADLSVSHRSTVSNRDRSPSKVRSQQSQANQSVRSVAGPASSVAANPFTEVESRADLSMSRMSRVGSQASRRGDEGATLRPMDMPQPESTGPPLPSAHMSQSQPPHEQHYGRDQRRRSSASCMHAEGSFGTNNSAYQMGAGAPASHVSQGHLQQHASQSHHSQATAGRTASAASGSMARMPSAVGPVSEGSQVPARLQASQRSMASRHSVGAQMPSRVSVGAQVPSEHASRAGAALPQQGVEQLPAGDDAARGEEAFVRNAHALRSVKRMSHDDFDRLRSYVNCPHPFAHYCLALGALLAGRSPIPFRNPLSLAGYWRGVQGLLASPTILFRLLSACDPWETTPQAQEFLASLEGQPLPDAGLRLVSPCAYALAEWVVTFGQKWRELGAPVMVDGEVQREERPPTPPSRRRGVVSVQTLMQRARNRSLTPTGRGRWGERSAGSRRDTSPGSSTPRGGSRSARQSPSSRAAAAARGPHPVWNFGTAGGNANPIENFGWQPRSPRGSPHRTLATDPATLEDRLLHALVDVRTLTPWDLSHLSNHTLQRNPLSAVVKACVKATAAMIGLAGPAPDDDTVDLFAVGTSALRSQPEEVLTAMRKLEASSVPMDVLEYVSQLLPETVNPSTPTPYLAVNVMRTWCAVMVEYQRAKAGGHVDFPDLPVKADAALASLGFASPARSPARQGAAGTAETSTNAALFSPARQTHGEGRASPERGSPRAAPPASPSRDGLRSPQRTRGSGRADLQLHAWLEDAGLGKYAEVFVEHEVDMDSLVLLNEADLNAMGLAIGPRRKIMAFIEARRGQQHQQ